jgi:hypothetical protein
MTTWVPVGCRCDAYPFAHIHADDPRKWERDYGEETKQTVTYQYDLFDAAKAKAERNERMAEVTEDEAVFADHFMQAIHNLPHGWTGTCEDIRRNWSGPQPHHHNVWGANWNAAKRLGLLVELPQQIHMTAVKSHARKTHLYRKP